MYIVLRTCKSIPAVSWWRDLSVYKWPIPNNVTIPAPYTCAASSPFASPSFSSRLYKCWGKVSKEKCAKTNTNSSKSNCGQDNCRKLGSANLVWSKWGPSVAHLWPGAPDDRQMVALHPVLHHDDDEDAVGDGDGHGHGIVNFVRPGTGDDDQVVALLCILLLSSWWCDYFGEYGDDDDNNGDDGDDDVWHELNRGWPGW